MYKAEAQENVVSFVAYRRQNHAAHFTRVELNQLLSLYGEKSRIGEWRHSTLDQRYGLVAYSVYSDPLERPVYCIVKCDRAHRQKGKYVLFANKKRVKQCQTMSELLIGIKGAKIS